MRQLGQPVNAPPGPPQVEEAVDSPDWKSGVASTPPLHIETQRKRMTQPIAAPGQPPGEGLVHRAQT